MGLDAAGGPRPNLHRSHAAQCVALSGFTSVHCEHVHLGSTPFTFDLVLGGGETSSMIITSSSSSSRLDEFFDLFSALGLFLFPGVFPPGGLCALGSFLTEGWPQSWATSKS